MLASHRCGRCLASLCDGRIPHVTIPHHRADTIDLANRWVPSPDRIRAAILKSMVDVEPDLEREQWSPPVLTRTPDNGLRCPVCDRPLQFECFTRIRPPPLEFRGRSLDLAITRAEIVQN